MTSRLIRTAAAAAVAADSIPSCLYQRYESSSPSLLPGRFAYLQSVLNMAHLASYKRDRSCLTSSASQVDGPRPYRAGFIVTRTMTKSSAQEAIEVTVPFPRVYG